MANELLGVQDLEEKYGLEGVALPNQAEETKVDTTREGKDFSILKSCVESDGGYFSSRSPMGSRFDRARARDVELGKSYKLCKTDAERAEFRREFAMAQYQKGMERKSKQRSYRKVDITKGKYKLPFKILEDQ
eukprot:3699421-Karenia_brevis.AAC.1